MSHPRPTPAGGSGRVTLASAEILVGVTAAHVWAGGALPSVPHLIGLAGLVFLATDVVLRRGTSKRVMIPALLAGQVALHHLLTASATPHAGHAMHAAADSSAGWMGWQMAAAHAASAALTLLVWWLRARVLRHLDRLPRQLILAVAAAATPSPSGRAMLQRPRPWLTGAPRRGPPTLTLWPA